ncbi:hypothetical protein BDF21DRAFT_459002 [Thamnidium elegans]|nr:hypothetical protein BDF21DRAFT_459002 [Thamnidium elegans]
MEDSTFEDARFLEYCRERDRELQEDPIGNQTIPQYINDLNEQALQDPDVIYISSDEESEDEETGDSAVKGYIGIPHTSEDNDSDSSYYTCNTHGFSPPEIEDDISRLDIASGSESVRPITDNTRDIIVIDDDDSEDDNIRIAPKDYGTDSVRCNECNILTTRNEVDLLSNLSYVRNKRQPYCLGCSRLHAFAICDEEVSDIIRWLVTGKIPSYDLPPESTYRSIMRRIIKRRKCMEKRVERAQGDGSELVTSSELFCLCIESKFKCAITGHYLYFHSGRHNRLPYWALSLDHINALHHCKKSPTSWSKDNIQLMSAVLNSIKGHVTNEELIRWHTDFMNSKVIIL